MGEQLICKLNPMSDAVKKQLGQLRDQWQSLNQVAASQSRSLDGTKSLQDFNKKVEKLEAWINDKVENILVFYVTEIRWDWRSNNCLLKYRLLIRKLLNKGKCHTWIFISYHLESTVASHLRNWSLFLQISFLSVFIYPSNFNNQ